MTAERWTNQTLVESGLLQALGLPATFLHDRPLGQNVLDIPKLGRVLVLLPTEQSPTFEMNSDDIDLIVFGRFEGSTATLEGWVYASEFLTGHYERKEMEELLSIFNSGRSVN